MKKHHYFLIVAGVLAAAGVGYYFYKKQKAKPTASKMSTTQPIAVKVPPNMKDLLSD